MFEGLIAAIGRVSKVVEAVVLVCMNSLDGDDSVGAEVELFQGAVVKRKDCAEAGHVLPEEADEPQLTQNTDDFLGALTADNDSVDTTAKDLDSLDQGICVVEEGGRLFAAEEVLYVGQGYGLIPACPFQHMVDLRRVGGSRIGQVGDEE